MKRLPWYERLIDGTFDVIFYVLLPIVIGLFIYAMAMLYHIGSLSNTGHLNP